MQLAGVAGEDVFRGRGGDDNQVNRRRIDIRALKGITRRVKGKIGTAFVRRGNMALFNTGTGANPLVGGVHPLGEFLVGHNPLRQVTAGAEDFAVNHAVGSSAVLRFC